MKTKTGRKAEIVFVSVLSKVLSLLINCHVHKFEIQRKREIKWLAGEAQREKERQRPRARDKKQRRHFFCWKNEMKIS